MFKQKVTTDDVFLGMSGKNTSTACCEDLLVCIFFKHMIVRYHPESQYAFMYVCMYDKWRAMRNLNDGAFIKLGPSEPFG